MTQTSPPPLTASTSAAPLFNIGGIASGLDTNTIIGQLLAIERQPEVRALQQQHVEEARQNALRDVNTRLTNLQTAIAGLRDVSTWGDVQSVTSSDAAERRSRADGRRRPGRLPGSGDPAGARPPGDAVDRARRGGGRRQAPHRGRRGDGGRRRRQVRRQPRHDRRQDQRDDGHPGLRVGRELEARALGQGHRRGEHDLGHRRLGPRHGPRLHPVARRARRQVHGRRRRREARPRTSSQRRSPA